ncbi:MAG TPA: RAMP superfamily CRISPR-associated protein [Candidatus Cloacimonadota bacterium]|mgnify:CR=1 FL=1|nr:RAMP superfamily CRISPR-associated protein [Candidatus Cloacimonadota bacterium]
MSDFMYQIRFLTDWHCGSGLTSGADVDALVIKDTNQLPFIPGKTIKGLFREAAEQIAHYETDKNKWDHFILEVFGKGAEKNDKNNAQRSLSHFSNVVLSEYLQMEFTKSANDKDLLTPFLYRKITSTKIDKNGIAAERSLRKVEVTVPLVLYGKVTDVKDEYKAFLIKCAKYIKRMGTNRNRGLGACVISEVEE